MTATAKEVRISYGFGEPDEFGDLYHSVCDCLTEEMSKLTDETQWVVMVNNFGWRRLHGFKIFTAETGEELLQEVLPRTECSFNIIVLEDEIRIQNFHHDSPAGNEWYYIRPATCCEGCGEVLDCIDDYGDFSLAPHRLAYGEGNKKVPVCEHCSENWDWDFVEEEDV